MSDKAINNIISKIYAKIIVFFLFIFFIFLSVYFSFLYGINIKKLHTPYVHLEELYIKWDKKLIISAKKVLLVSSDATKKKVSNKSFDSQTFFELLVQNHNFFQKIDIKEFRYKNLHISAFYKNSHGVFTLKTHTIDAHGELFINDNELKITLNSLHHTPLDISLHGDMVFDKSKKTFVGHLDSVIANEAFFKLEVSLQNSILHYKADFLQPIRNTAKILSKVQLPKLVEYWAITAIDTKEVDVKKLEGKIDLNDLSNSYKNLHVIAIANAKAESGR